MEKLWLQKVLILIYYFTVVSSKGYSHSIELDCWSGYMDLQGIKLNMAYTGPPVVLCPAPGCLHQELTWETPAFFPSQEHIEE